MYGQIYKITHPDHPHYYYGQTTKDLEDRLQEHIYHSNSVSETDLHMWIREVNSTSLIISLKAFAKNDTELNDLEDEFIGDLWKDDPFCLNMKPGGNYPLSGELHWNSKLTQEEVDNLREKWLNGSSTEHIASTAGVSVTTAKKFLRNDTYHDPNYDPKVKRLSQQKDRTEKGNKIRDFISQNPKMTFDEVGNLFNYSREMISAIHNNRALVDKTRAPVKKVHWKEKHGISTAAERERLEIRLFAQNHPDWKGSRIAKNFGIDPKRCRMILRNDKQYYDPLWDAKNRQFLDKC